MTKLTTHLRLQLRLGWYRGTRLHARGFKPEVLALRALPVEWEWRKVA
jgi:hypothetical protein